MVAKSEAIEEAFLLSCEGLWTALWSQWAQCQHAWKSSWLSPKSFWVTVFSAPQSLYCVNTFISRRQGRLLSLLHLLNNLNCSETVQPLQADCFPFFSGPLIFCPRWWESLKHLDSRIDIRCPPPTLFRGHAMPRRPGWTFLFLLFRWAQPGEVCPNHVRAWMLREPVSQSLALSF